MTKKPVRRNLGRGLSALLKDVDINIDRSGSQVATDTLIPIEKLTANPDQPRKEFDQDSLQDLANSLAEKGIIQPLIVRPTGNSPHEYEIVAGERRWRAAQMAQIHKIPVIIRDLDDTEVLELGIIENIQRADLNSIEEAQGFQQLMERFGHTQEKVAQALGKSRSHVANLLRLLTLPEEILTYVRQGKLSAGHARALVPSDNAIALARQIIGQNLNVRQAEVLVKTGPGTGQKKRHLSPKKDADTRAIEADLTAQLRLKVSINHRHSSGKGELKLSYNSLDELDGLCRLLSN